MVLKNSKYDKQAKKQYLKKHGLYERPKTTIRPKWSSKKQKNPEMLKLEIDEMTSDWDSDIDEDIVNYFYPAISEELPEMPLEMKRKVKRQVIEDLKLQRNELFNQDIEANEETIAEMKENGIFLGQESYPEVKLTEFIPQIPLTKRIRKIPINRDDDDLNDYGISVSDTVTNNDYNEVYRKKLAERRLDQILNEELIGFKVGKDSLGEIKSKKNNVQVLDEEELKKDEELTKKNDQQKFYNEIKRKFGAPQKSKVLELNNYDNNNPDHVKLINNKLAFEDEGDLDADLDELLGTNFKSMSLDQDTVVDQDTVAPTKTYTYGSVSSTKPSAPQDDFLDELLG